MVNFFSMVQPHTVKLFQNSFAPISIHSSMILLRVFDTNIMVAAKAQSTGPAIVADLTHLC